MSTHDPLCPLVPGTCMAKWSSGEHDSDWSCEDCNQTCQCGLILGIEKRTLDAAEQAVAKKQTQIAEDLIEHLWGTEYPSDEGDCCAELVVNSAVAAIRGLREEK